MPTEPTWTPRPEIGNNFPWSADYQPWLPTSQPWLIASDSWTNRD